MPAIEKIKTLIVTTASDFRSKVVPSLNGLGFAAEKTIVESLGAIGKATADLSLCNLIVDAASLDSKDFTAFCQKISAEVSAAPHLHVLILLPASRMAEVEKLPAELQRFLVRPTPPKRQDLVDCFIRPISDKKKVDKKALLQSGDVPKAAPQAQPAGNSNPAVTDAIEHVRITIEQLKTLAKDLSATEALQAIGQRFNGLYGTFKFVGKDGYREISRLSDIIDCVARTYADNRPITQPHADLLMRSAKAAFAFLRGLRDGQAATAAQRDEFAAIDAEFTAQADLFHRESNSQSDVDDLLAKLGA